MTNPDATQEQSESRWPKDRPLHWRLHVSLIAAGVLALLFARIGRSYPDVVEHVYTEHIGQWIGRFLAFLTHWWPYSLIEYAAFLLAVLFLVKSVDGIVAVVRGKRRIANLAARGVLWTTATLGAIVALFYVTWGFNYDRAPLLDRLHWQQWAQTQQGVEPRDELKRLCSELVDITNASYEQAFGSSDVGHPSDPPYWLEEMYADLDLAYTRVAQRLNLHPSFAISRGRAKEMLGYSEVMSYMLISGVYTPWTGEANYNWQIPKCRVPEVVAHERAHQRGVTSEDEANFFGFLVSISSDQPYTRYSGYLMAQQQLLRELRKLDTDAATELIGKRIPGIKRDVEAIDAFRKAHAGRMSDFQSHFNDAYLRMNNVKAGVAAYQLSSRLILAFARQNGGSCILKPEKS